MPNLLRVLVIGFAAVIALLAAAAIVEVNNARSVTASAGELVKNQLITERLLDSVQREQQVLNAALYRLSSTPEKVDRERVLADLDQTDAEIRQMASEAQGGPNEAAWSDLKTAALDFSQEARQVLSTGAAVRELFSRHEYVTARVAHLVDLSDAHAVETRRNMAQQSERLAHESALLIGASLVVALLAAFITVGMAARVFRQMEFQTGELSRVSFRLLETQESIARRFAHELHDELGGALTAIKSNLVAIGTHLGNNGDDRARIDDCMKLVDQSISNVRELSQLLRPTILDDFGLDAGIRWLVDRFRDRTSIETEYRSEFTGRLQDETETHLFRIVQEALTNIARHSGATRVFIHLRREGDEIRLTIQDNGKGLQKPRAAGMGLSGMRARARSAGGELQLRSTPGQGVTIDVHAPLGKIAIEETV
jgi:signal transduction histidine kinase